jgi:hypothetical protein
VLHRYVILIAAGALILIASGACITSIKDGLPMLVSVLHTIGAAILGILTLGLAIWLSRALAWIAFAIIVVDSTAGWFTLPLVHASVAPLFFATIVAIAVYTSPGWKQNPDVVDDRGRPSLRYLAIATPPVVFVQILLGVVYRHKLTSVMPHMAGAMIAALLTLIVSMVLMQQYPEHQPLRRAAIALMSAVLTQVALGVGAFTMQLLDMDNTPAGILFAVLHVTTGSLALAASMVLAIQVQRHIRETPFSAR